MNVKSFCNFVTAVISVLLLTMILTGHVLAKEYTWKNIDRIVAIGDIHGDHDQFIKALRSTGLIDVQNNWVGGKTHLVQTGDVLDRGPNSRKSMDLLIKLERQALESGGHVHSLIGNHEVMVLSQDLRYVSEGEYSSFGGKDEYLNVMAVEGKYGKWIASHNTVIKINDVLFVHGGISPKFATMDLGKMNRLVRAELRQPAGKKKMISGDSKGPVWYRGLAMKKESELDVLLKTLQKSHGVDHVVIGHSIVKDRKIKTRSGGRIIMIDVGMSRCYGPASVGSLLIERGGFYAIYPEAIPLESKKQRLLMKNAAD